MTNVFSKEILRNVEIQPNSFYCKYKFKNAEISLNEKYDKYCVDFCYIQQKKKQYSRLLGFRNNKKE